MTQFFDIDAANEALIEVGPLLATLADQRAELIRLRDRALAAHSAASTGGPAGLDEDEAQRIRLRMQGIVDQMAAAVARIDGLGITLRDIEQWPDRLPGSRGRPPGLAVLGARRGRRGVLARAGHRVRVATTAHRARMTERQVVVGTDGRAKAYRPLPADARIAAVRAGLEAYAAGDYFEAHELMEPAWMGTADLAERYLIQGLIKVAAADVHAVRGNPAGVRRNLEGARDRLRSGATGSITGVELDVVGLLAAIDERLARSTGLETPISIDWRTR